MDAPHKVSRKEWLHGELRCPACGPHVSSSLDLDSYERTQTDSRATGALVTHRRCGATFRIEFSD